MIVTNIILTFTPAPTNSTSTIILRVMTSVPIGFRIYLIALILEQDSMEPQNALILTTTATKSKLVNNFTISHSQYLTSPHIRNSTAKKARVQLHTPLRIASLVDQNTQQRRPYQQHDVIDESNPLECSEQDYEEHQKDLFNREVPSFLQHHNYDYAPKPWPHENHTDITTYKMNNKSYPTLSRYPMKRLDSLQMRLNDPYRKRSVVRERDNSQTKTTKKPSRIISHQTPTPVAQPTEKKTVCNCKKSKCLKLYCDCFAAGQLCGKDCNCNGCCNKDLNNTERKITMNQIIERNKSAFESKVQTHLQDGQQDKKHYKGCNCKKSNCQKKYCECFQNGVSCSDLCKCVQCKNCDDSKKQKKGQKYRPQLCEDSVHREHKKMKHL